MGIKDPEVHRLAHLLAGRRGISATRAVRRALEEALRHDESSRSGIADRLMELHGRSLAMTEPVLSDEDLYDDHGLSR